MSTIAHEDGRKRCSWPGTDPLYIAYHDTDWGVPERDSRALFEKLLLDGFHDSRMAVPRHQRAEAKVVVDILVVVDVVNLAAFSIFHKNWIRLVVAIITGYAERDAFESALVSGRRFRRAL